MKSDTPDWKSPKSERPTCVRSPAVRCTPFVIASSATISPTPSPTPTAVKAVRDGRRSRFRQIRPVQLMRRTLPRRFGVWRLCGKTA